VQDLTDSSTAGQISRSSSCLLASRLAPQAAAVAKHQQQQQQQQGLVLAMCRCWCCMVLVLGCCRTLVWH
jgi:hypothetical protein